MSRPNYKHNFGESEGLFMVMDFNNKFGFIDQNGQSIIPCKYFFAIPFSEGLAGVTENSNLDGGWGYINKKGEKVISGNFDAVDNFHNGTAKVTINDKFGFINKQGKIILPIVYDKILEREPDVYTGEFVDKEVLGNGLLLVKKNGLYGYIDCDKTIELIPCIYTHASAFKEGLAAVSMTDKKSYSPIFGYINTEGQLVLPFEYDSARPFIEGCAIVSKIPSEKLIFIDKFGNKILPNEYDYCLPFKNGTAFVKEGYREYYINKTGACVKGCIE